LRHEIHLAVPGFQSSALVLIAQLYGFFRDEGIMATVEFAPTGRDCLDLVIRGRADYAVVFETPVVHAARAGAELAILTELHRSDLNSAVATRKDRGIQAAEDLIGKKVAVVSRTNAEFLLDLLIRSRLIDSKALHIIPMSASEAVDALVSGAVDAAALWEPYLSQAIANDPGAFELLRSSYYTEFSMLVGLRGAVEGDRDSALALLRALKKAEDYLLANGKGARAAVDKFLVENGFFVSQATWERTYVHLGLSATLLTMLEEELAWHNERAGTPHRTLMRQLLRSHYLAAVAPRTVTYK
jgi:ABC-type nitrate/sulfonate/bicarbonate transport system substrate-binding protein